MRKIYIDVGANLGETLAKFGASNPGYELYAIEPNIKLLTSIAHNAAKIHRKVTIVPAAAWVCDGIIQLFHSARHESATVVQGKRTNVEDGWPPIDYSCPTEVRCFDFATWISENFRFTELIVKMDIEGAEYQVLGKMLSEGTLRLIRTLYCEWHYDRLPQVSAEEHTSLKKRVAEVTELFDWEP